MVGSKFKANLAIDIKKFISPKQIESLTKNLGVYEQKLKRAVEDLNLKGKDAREKSRVQIDKFTAQLKKTQGEVQRQVQSLLHQEGKVLNQRLNDLVQYLKSVAYQDSTGAKKKAAAKSESVAAGASAAPKKTARKTTKAKPEAASTATPTEA